MSNIVLATQWYPKGQDSQARIQKWILVWTYQWCCRSTLPLREQRDVSFGPPDGLVLRYWRTFKEPTACPQPELQTKVSAPLRTLHCRTFWGRGFRSSYSFQYSNLFQSFATVSGSFTRFHKVFLPVSAFWCWKVVCFQGHAIAGSRQMRDYSPVQREETPKHRNWVKKMKSLSIIEWGDMSLPAWCCQWCHLIIHPHVDKPIDFNVWHSFTLLLVWTNSVPRRVWFLSGNRSATPSTRRLGRRWKHAAVFATYCLTKLTKLNQTFGTLWPSLSSFWTWTNDDRWWYIAWHMIFVQTKIRTQAYHNL